MTSRRVLCLDDDVVIAQLVANVVRYCGHEAVLETDSMEAVLKWSHAGFGAAVVDLMMPRLTGIEVLSAFMENSPHCRRILFTAAPHEAEVEEALREGIVQRVIVKPMQLHEMQSALDWL